MLCDANGVPLRFLLSGGQASDITYAQPLLDDVSIPMARGRPRKRCRWLLADKGYDAEALRQYCDRYRMQPVIPLRSMKRKVKPGLPRLFDRPKYRQRNIIERMFGWLKENRRIVTRFDKLAKSFAAMVALACAMRCLRHYFRTEPRAHDMLLGWMIKPIAVGLARARYAKTRVRRHDRSFHVSCGHTPSVIKVLKLAQMSWCAQG